MRCSDDSELWENSEKRNIVYQKYLNRCKKVLGYNSFVISFLKAIGWSPRNGFNNIGDIHSPAVPRCRCCCAFSVGDKSVYNEILLYGNILALK